MREQIAQQTYSQTVDTDDGEYDDVWPTRMPNSTLRYQPPIEQETGDDRNPNRRLTAVPPRRTAIQPGTYTNGNTKLNVHYGAPPTKNQKRTPRPNVNRAQPPDVIYGQPYRDTEDSRPRGLLLFLRRYGLLLFGIIAILMIVGFIAISYLASWWQGVQDSWQYGMPRTYQTDANVGHAGRVSHFIVLNNDGEIEVIETQKGHPEAAHIYTVVALPSDQATVPVYITFEDINHDGKIDALIHYGEGNNQTEVPMYNNGTSFQSQPPGSK